MAGGAIVDCEGSKMKPRNGANRAGPVGAEAVPTVTLRADNPVHMWLLLFAQRGADGELGPGSAVAVELCRLRREFEMFWKRRGGLKASLAITTDPQLRRF